MTTSVTFYAFPPALTPVRLASTANVAGTYLNGQLNNGVGATLSISGGLASLDGVTLALYDYVVLNAQTNANENGIYQVTSLGTPTVLTRRPDMQSIEQLKEGQFVSVGEGSTLAGSIWVVGGPLPESFGINDLILNPSSVPSGGTFLVAANNLSDVASVATARTNLGAQAAANIKAATTGNIGGAGAGPITVPVVGLTAASVVVATIESSSNPASVISATAGVGGFDVTFSADPGASCLLNYVAFVAAQ